MTPTHIAPPIPLPRVPVHKPPPPTYTPASTIQHHSQAPKNSRFANKIEHRYPLRSKTCIHTSTSCRGTNFRHLASQQLLAQHLFQYHANHIYRDNGTKELIDSILKDPTRHVRNATMEVLVPHTPSALYITTKSHRI